MGVGRKQTGCSFIQISGVVDPALRVLAASLLCPTRLHRLGHRLERKQRGAGVDGRQRDGGVRAGRVQIVLFYFMN